MASNVHFEGRDAAISVRSFLKVIQRYIPETIFAQANLKRIELRETFFFEEDGRKEVQYLLDNSNHKFRMYGTALELCQNLKIYRHFPRNYHFFDFDICEPYSTKPLIYKSLNNKEFICKQDVYTHIMNMILNKYDVIKKNLFARAIMVLFLKWTESTVSVAHEFVSCTNEQFVSIEASLVKMMRERMKNPRSVLILVTNTVEEVLGNFAALLPMAWDDNRFATIRIFLHEVMGRLPPRFAHDHYSKMYNTCESLIEALKQIMKDRPAIFQPNELLVTGQRPRPTLRMFEDGKKKFLTYEELVATKNACIGKSKTSEFCPNGGIETLDASSTEGQEVIKCSMSQIDYIRVPIVRSKHRAQWVYSRSGTPYILASDVFFELLYEWTFGLKLFQRLTDEDESHKIIEKFFEFQPDNIFFMSIHSYDMAMEWNRRLESELSYRPAKDVRNAKKDGFTEQNLKNELVHLGLNRILPRITEHTGVVYAHVCKEKKERVLRTCDLFDAIYHCVLIEFIKCFKYTSYIHSQNGCHRVLDIDCPCRKATAAPEKPSSEVPGAPSEVAKAPMARPEVEETPKAPMARPEVAETPKAPMARPEVAETPKAPMARPEVAETPKAPMARPEVVEAPVALPEVMNAPSAPPQTTAPLEVAETPEAPVAPKMCENCPKHKKVAADARKEYERTTKKMFKAKEKLIEQNKKLSDKYKEEQESWKKKFGEIQARLSKVETSGMEQVKEATEQLAAARKKKNELEMEVEELKMELKEKEAERQVVKNKFAELCVLNADKDLIIQKLRRQLEELKAQKPQQREEVAPGMKRVLVGLQEKLNQLQTENLWEKAVQRHARLSSIATNEAVRQMGRAELEVFKGKYEAYEKAITANIERIQTDVTVSHNDLLPVPETPAFSELFEQELLLAEQENEKLGKECLICREELPSTVRLPTCLHCKTRYHLECINSWKQVDPTCPNCRKPINGARK